MIKIPINNILKLENIRSLLIEIIAVIFISLILTYISNQFLNFNIDEKAYEFIIIFLVIFLIFIIALDSYFTSKTKNEYLQLLKNINSVKYISTANIKQDPTILTYQELTNLVEKAENYILAIGSLPSFPISEEGNDKLKKRRDTAIKKYFSTIENKVNEGITYKRITTLNDIVDKNQNLDDIFGNNLANHYRNILKIKHKIFKTGNIECRYIITINCPTFLIVDGKKMLYGVRHLKGIQHLKDMRCNILTVMIQNGIVFNDFNGSIIPDFEMSFNLLFDNSEDIFKEFNFS